MTNLLRPEDYPDPDWCPDCGEPRGVCRCDEMQGDDWNEYYLNAILVQWGNALALLAETQKDFYIEMAKIANIDSMPGEIEIVLTLAAWEQAKGDNHE